MEKSTNPAEELFAIERIFNAPVEMVWEAYTTPQYVSRWWGPHGFTTPVCKIDFKVGGRFHYCMKGPDGKEYWNVGEFKEIVPLKKIVSVMYMSDKDGNQVDPSGKGFADDFAKEVPDVVVFETVAGGKTKVIFRTNHTVESAKKYGMDEGMKQSLDKFEDVLKSIK